MNSRPSSSGSRPPCAPPALTFPLHLRSRSPCADALSARIATFAVHPTVCALRILCQFSKEERDAVFKVLAWSTFSPGEVRPPRTRPLCTCSIRRSRALRLLLRRSNRAPRSCGEAHLKNAHVHKLVMCTYCGRSSCKRATPSPTRLASTSS